jgi:gluconate kinase
MATAIVLYGPKAVGKSWVAEVLRTHLGVAHVDADELVGDLLAAGTPPDPVDGWLTWVRRRVVDALARQRSMAGGCHPKGPANAAAAGPG